jgi:hypothetical protein
MLAIALPDSARSLERDGVREVAMDAELGRALAKELLRQAEMADRCADSEELARRIEYRIGQAIEVALATKIDPVVGRRRAVASALHRLADMISTGTLVAVETLWMDQEFSFQASTGRGRMPSGTHSLIDAGGAK